MNAWNARKLFIDLHIRKGYLTVIQMIVVDRDSVTNCCLLACLQSSKTNNGSSTAL